MDSNVLPPYLIDKIRKQINFAKINHPTKSQFVEPYSTKDLYVKNKITNCITFCDKEIPEFDTNDETNLSDNEYVMNSSFLQE